MSKPINAAAIDYRVSPVGRASAALYGLVCMSAGVAGSFAAVVAVVDTLSFARVAGAVGATVFTLWMALMTVRFLRDAVSRRPRLRIRNDGLFVGGLLRDRFVAWDRLQAHDVTRLPKANYSIHTLQYRTGGAQNRQVIYLPDGSGLRPDELHLAAAIRLRRGKSKAEVDALTRPPWPSPTDGADWDAKRHGGIRGP